MTAARPADQGGVRPGDDGRRAVGDDGRRAPLGHDGGEPLGHEAQRSLLRDRLLVTASALVWVVGTLFGTGLVGPTGGVAEQGEGLFSDTATLIAPMGPAFSIWSAIYLGLAGYVVWQWLPATDRSRWAAVTRIPAAAAIALNGLWLLVVFAGWIWLSVLVMALLVVALGRLLVAIAGLPREGWAVDLLVSLTFGTYLGWICVATCANIASALVGTGVEPATNLAAWVTIAVLAVVVGIVAFLLRRSGQRWHRLGLAAAVVWGTSWIAAARLTGELRSDLVGWAAVLTALAVAALGAWSLTRRATVDRPPPAARAAG